MQNKIKEMDESYRTYIGLRNTFDDENTTRQIGETLDMCIDIYDILKKKKNSKKSKKKKLDNKEDNVTEPNKKLQVS
ncbi:hypothetical protein PFHG_05671 [Plasmodium falciparum HB3]|uniref:Uncharacterized protein n=1 Tax=Plasmodium falciparum (isolate HB3) TaxID=137071 RepID=A0A0L7KIB8_PLAFX|nr:hypothetical protein PFHG_05671 [Plasmodium falciparum HB3]